MNLIDTIIKARKGQAVSHLGARFRLTELQTQQALETLIELMGDAVVRVMQTPTGLAEILSELASPQHKQDLEAPALFEDSRILSNGAGLLSLLFRNEATIRVVACYAAQSAHADTDAVRRLMPYAAIFYMAALAERSQKPLERLASRLPDDPPPQQRRQPHPVRADAFRQAPPPKGVKRRIEGGAETGAEAEAGPGRLAKLVLSANPGRKRKSNPPHQARRDRFTIKELLASIPNVEPEE